MGFCHRVRGGVATIAWDAVRGLRSGFQRAGDPTGTPATARGLSEAILVAGMGNLAA